MLFSVRRVFRATVCPCEGLPCESSYAQGTRSILELWCTSIPGHTVLDSLDVEPDCRDRRDDLAELHFVEDGGLPGGVKADHQHPHLLLPEQTREELTDAAAHRATKGVWRGGGGEWPGVGEDVASSPLKDTWS